MPKNNPSAAEREEVIARELGLPLAHVHGVLKHLKQRNRIAAGRPVPPPLTSIDLARCILGCCSPLPSRAADIEIALGGLPRTSGDGAPDAEVELADLLDEAAGNIGGNIDFRSGEILLSADPGQFLAIYGRRFDRPALSRVYRRARVETGMARTCLIKLPALRRIACELL
ncbi:hypothetical protein [Ciceribacter sp. L1K22]|uniref:hypothetical protein n=1 Tax=Ciceribacter sp. L1K22 TaxID=2820275 RepID=UPI001ABEE763|nr:hypothetical protein [Ciceribacter sp. L1K22]MBO3760031.1 hypothetical protein [Ciceribacter sp. L1K22]